MGDKVSIIGGGSWGTAIAQLLAQNGHTVQIKVRDKKQVLEINKSHSNKNYFPQYRLLKNISATDNYKDILEFSNYIFLAIPTHTTRLIIEEISEYPGNHIFISTAKGFEEDTFLRNSEIISNITGRPVAVLSGPTHAEEVISNIPTAAVVASKNQIIANYIQDLMMSPTFRVYTNPDVSGVEIGGAVKNVIALASGIADGLGYGDNTKAALITRGLHEMSRLGSYLGAKKLTFAGLTGMGDLVVTCTSMHSRNRRFGIEIGKGSNLEKAKNAINQTVEGVRTTRAIYNWYKKKKPDFELPITTQIYNVLFENKDPHQAVDDLMVRGPKHEIEDVAYQK